MSISDNTSSELYEVEKIIDVSGEGSKRLFLVKWKGFSNEDNTWEPEENLQANGDKISEFFEKRQGVRKETKTESKKSSPKSRKSQAEQIRQPAVAQQNVAQANLNGSQAKQYVAVKGAKVDDTEVSLLVEFVENSKSGREYVKMNDLAKSNSKLIVDYFEILLRNKYAI